MLVKIVHYFDHFQLGPGKPRQTRIRGCVDDNNQTRLMYLQIKNLNKTYGHRRVVDNVDMILVEGGLLSLVGPSGYGKTFALRMNAGLVQPVSGSILCVVVTHVSFAAGKWQTLMQIDQQASPLTVNSATRFAISTRECLTFDPSMAQIFQTECTT